MSAEIQAWVEDYEQKLRTEAECGFLLRLLRTRFGELPAAAVDRIEAASRADLERWGERMLSAQTLVEVLDDPS